MPELSQRRRLLVLAICCMSLFIVSLDNTIVNVALPSMQHDLHAKLSGLQWTIDAYVLVLASLLMLSGSTADRFGRRRVFQTGLVTFTAGSLLCSVAPSLGWLIAFRMLQAVGGSMLNPVAMSIITNTFTEPRERARAIGVWGGVVGLSMSLGPVTGGLLVQSAGWRSIFWINVPIGIAALVLAQLFVPESRAAVARRIDPAGQAFVIILLGSLCFGIIEGPSHGWTSAEILSCFGVAVAALIAFVITEMRVASPLIDLAFFRSAPFSGAVVIAICGFSALSGFLFLNTLYLQNVRGFSALHAGLCTLPMAAMSLIFAPLSGRLVGARGPRPSLVLAGIGIAISGVLLVNLTATTSLPALLLTYVVFGFGFAMVNAPITNTAVSGMPLARAGTAAAVASTSRQIGQALGVAILGSVVTSGIHGPFRTSFASASHAGWWIVAASGVMVASLGLVTTGAWARRTAESTASRMLPPTGSATPAGASSHR